METPSLSAVLAKAIDAALLEMHTCLPGKVVRVDVTKSQCDVEPLLKRQYWDGEIVALPVITNVPIGFYRAGKAFISLPVKIGDFVELRFSERSLDLWLLQGGLIDPNEGRKFHLSDAIAYPGLYPFSDPPVGASATDIIIKNDVAKITLNPTGKFKIEGAGAELLDLLISVLSQLETITTTLGTTQSTAPGTPISTAAAFAAQTAAITSLKTLLNGLKA